MRLTILTVIVTFLTCRDFKMPIWQPMTTPLYPIHLDILWCSFARVFLPTTPPARCRRRRSCLAIGAEGRLLELRPPCSRVAVCGAVDARKTQLGVGDVLTVGADHACFERVDEEFEQWEAGAYQGEGEYGLSEEDWDPEVVD